jgi:hypothetical protein
MEPIFKLNKLDTGWEIYAGDNLIASTVGSQFIIDENNQDLWEVSDDITESENGLYKIERTYVNTSAIDIDAVFMFEINAMFPTDFFMIPCVSYNGNQWGTGNEPKGLTHNGEPWVFAYDRVSIPSATFSENDDYALAVFVSDCDSESLSSACSLVKKQGNGLTHRIFWPERETPVTYTGRDIYGPAIEKTVKVKSKEKFAVQFYVSVAKTKIKNYGWTLAFDRAWKIFRRPVTYPVSGATYRKWRVEYIKNIQYTRLYDKYSLFEMGLLASGVNYVGTPGEEFKVRENYRYEIGWCGQNASEALALLHDYAVAGDIDSLEKGCAVLDTWAEYAPVENKNGLFHVVFDSILNQNEKYDIDTCNLGWGAWIMLEAYKMAKTFDLNKPAWLKFALDLCGFSVSNRAPDGSFGKTWDKKGICTDSGGTIGCYILLPFMAAYRETHDIKYLNVTKEMYLFYVKRDLLNVSCTAGALDTHCIDKETCWPLCKIGLDLYEDTQDVQFLEYAELAGYYMLSFMFHYDALYEPDSDFTQLGYRTYGGTSVSTQHHHLDPWGSLLSYDWYRLYKITGDETWKERFQAGWMNAMLGVSDGNLTVHGIKRPISSQNEGFWQCNWTPGNHKRGMFNDWLQSWPGAFKILTMIREPDWTLFENQD